MFHFPFLSLHLRTISLVALTLAGSFHHQAYAHIVLQEPAAAAGTSYRATFRVGHGCADMPTHSLRITIPPGFNGAQPMPKAGWNVRTVSGKLAQPYTRHGTAYTDGVQEISWTAISPDNALPSAHYDEFVIRGTTPSQPGPLWFKVVQGCRDGAKVASNDWLEVPVSGTSTKGLKSPAALLEVLDVQTRGEHTH